MKNPEDVQQQPLQILLVEDNPAHAELVRRGLADHRVATDIYHVSDGKAALKYLFRRGAYADTVRSPRPHVILLDLHLPKISGLNVLRQIKRSDELKNIPVVILSTSGRDLDITRAYEQQANGYVVKPTDFAQFSQVIEALASYWLTWNRTSWPEEAT